MPLPSPLLILLMLLYTANADRKKIVDSAVTAAAAAGGATVTQTADDLQSHSSRELPLGEASLHGVSHILIPVSTMELFFAASLSVHPIVSNEGAAVDVDNLTARVSALEGGLANQSGVLDDTNTNSAESPWRN